MGTTSSRTTYSNRSTVHPHAHGDDAVSFLANQIANGSSPRAWGRPRAGLFRHRGYRFTSTGVGDHESCWVSFDYQVGSPPRAWGRRRLVRGLRQAVRFTPTRVGTTSLSTTESTKNTVHPHARGDDHEVSTLTSKLAGSPPRAWGRRRRTAAAAAVVSVHPHARGDDRTVTSSPWPHLSVHPHARGDDASERDRASASSAVHPHARGDDVAPARPGSSYVAGSPPRAWGRLDLLHSAASSDVGSPPRAWGRRRAGSTAAPRMPGSPPRAWGRLKHIHPRNLAFRFTPTRVGTTRTIATSRSCVSAVHPHARGDDHARIARMIDVRPVHPHARGDDAVLQPGQPPLGRFTPTRVGTTTASAIRARKGTVHPHARGDDVRSHPTRLARLRFTPTRVGTTLKFRLISSTPTNSSPSKHLTLRGLAPIPHRVIPVPYRCCG